jgi:hypothetical protein
MLQIHLDPLVRRLNCVAALAITATGGHQDLAAVEPPAFRRRQSKVDYRRHSPVGYRKHRAGVDLAQDVRRPLRVSVRIP